jgi:NADPH-dependent 7-cyano-7-deazaguanine reductase QueF
MAERSKVIRVLDGRQVHVTLTAPVTHKCPVNASTDDDTVEVSYWAEGGVIEAESFATYLDLFEHMGVTIEELTTMIRDDLRASGIIGAKVTMWGVHGERVNVITSTISP